MIRWPFEGVVLRLWMSSALSSMATWVMQVGLFVYVLGRAGTATLAAVELIGTVPVLLAMPLAGVLADRADPRRLSIASMLIQAATLAAMAALLHAGVWLVAVLYAMQGLGNVVWAPARQRWLYAAVPPRGRAGANAALGSVAGLTTILGAAVGGVLAAWHPLAAIGCATVIQLLAAVPLGSRTHPPTHTVTAESSDERSLSRRRLSHEVLAGLRVLRSLPLARSIIWVGVAWGCIGGAYSVLLAGHITKDLGGGGAMLGSFYAIDGLAVILGSVAAARLPPLRHLSAYALAYVGQGGCWILVFATSTVSVTAGALALMRLASGVIIALDTTILLATVPVDLRGRVSSLHMTTYNAMARVSLALFGALLTVAGPRLLAPVSGAVSVLIGLLWSIVRRRGAQADYAAALEQ